MKNANVLKPLIEKKASEILAKARQAVDKDHPMTGSMVRIRYYAMKNPTERAKREASAVLALGGDLHEYTGYINKVWRSEPHAKSNPNNLYVNVYVLNRVNEAKPGVPGAFRTFNITKGDLVDLEVLS